MYSFSPTLTLTPLRSALLPEALRVNEALSTGVPPSTVLFIVIILLLRSLTISVLPSVEISASPFVTTPRLTASPFWLILNVKSDTASYPAGEVSSWNVYVSPAESFPSITCDFPASDVHSSIILPFLSRICILASAISAPVFMSVFDIVSFVTSSFISTAVTSLFLFTVNLTSDA